MMQWVGYSRYKRHPGQQPGSILGWCRTPKKWTFWTQEVDFLNRTLLNPPTKTPFCFCSLKWTFWQIWGDALYPPPQPTPGYRPAGTCSVIQQSYFFFFFFYLTYSQAWILWKNFFFFLFLGWMLNCFKIILQTVGFEIILQTVGFACPFLEGVPLISGIALRTWNQS